MTNKKISVIYLSVAVCGVFAELYGMILFNRHLLMEFPLFTRMILMILSQWLLFLVPGALMITEKKSLKDIGLFKKKILSQVLTGAVLAIAMSLVLTVLPVLAGFRDLVGITSYTKPWQFIYEFVHSVIGVALAEELIFRGYLYQKLLEIRNSERFATIVSSLLFGLFHIFNGNLIQVFMTALLGLLFCLFRAKIKGCTLLSLIIAHGLYDGLIALWLYIL